MISYFALLVSIMAACAAVYGAYINNEKLRLDLYNKRFEVYSTTIDFYQALMGWKVSDENQRIYLKFIKSFLESRFLFKPDVYKLLGQMRIKADLIIGFKEHAATTYAGMPDELVKEHKRMLEALADWNKNIDEISQLMLKYLDFQELSPWEAIRSWLPKNKCIDTRKKSGR
jgi:hypothetical protein